MAHIHLPDGVMPLEWCAVWFIVAGVLIGVAMLAARREAEFRQRILVAFLTVILFVVMMIPVPSPFGGTHVNLTSLAGIVAGPVGSAVVVFIVSVALSLIGHGGVTVLGANISVLYFESVAAYVFYRLLRRRFEVYASAFTATVVSLILSTVLTSAVLAVSITGSPWFYLNEYFYENPLVPWLWVFASPQLVFQVNLFYALLKAAELSSLLRFFTVFLAATAPANVSVAFIEAFITSVIVQSAARSRPDIVVAEPTMRRV